MISGLSTCYNPNSLRTVPGNRSLYFSPGEGSVCILTELGSLEEASGRREVRAELIKELESELRLPVAGGGVFSPRGSLEESGDRQWPCRWHLALRLSCPCLSLSF